MAREVPLLMPKMSMTMETGEVLTWLKNEGDAVTAGDPIAEVQTDKVDMEVESPVSGTLARIVATPGQVIDVGAPMGFITSDAEDLMSGIFDGPGPLASEPAPPGSDVAPQPGFNGQAHSGPTPVSRRGPIPAVPLARRRAAQLRVSLDEVTPTGPSGAITVQDVEKAAAAAHPASEVTPGAAVPLLASPPAAAPSVAPAPAAPAQPASAPAPSAPAQPASAAASAPAPSGGLPAGSADPGFADALAPRRKAIRAAVARTMVASTSVPQFTVFAELDLERVNQERNRLGWTTLLLRGLAQVLRKYPHVNAGWDDGANAPAAPKDVVGVALAVDSGVGLLAPVIRDPDKLAVGDLDALVRSTVDRARTGRLSAGDMAGATTTLSNLGGFGVPSFTSLLTPPQATALSVGAITPRPMVIGGGLAVRLGTTVGLTIDHRPVDGADGARLLADLKDLFNRPDALLG